MNHAIILTISQTRSLGITQFCPPCHLRDGQLLTSDLKLVPTVAYFTI